jgi:hypothetical protein
MSMMNTEYGKGCRKKELPPVRNRFKVDWTAADKDAKTFGTLPKGAASLRC